MTPDALSSSHVPSSAQTSSCPTEITQLFPDLLPYERNLHGGRSEVEVCALAAAPGARPSCGSLAERAFPP